MRENTGFYVDDVAIPVSWRVAQADKDDRKVNKVNGVTRANCVPKGNYSVTALSSNIVELLNQLDPARSFKGQTSLGTNTIGITTSATTFEILTDDQNVAQVSTSTPHSAN